MLKWAKSSTTEMRSQAFLSESWSLDLLLENSSASSHSSHSSHFHWPFPVIPISIRTLRLGGAPPVKMAILRMSPLVFFGQTMTNPNESRKPHFWLLPFWTLGRLGKKYPTFFDSSDRSLWFNKRLRFGNFSMTSSPRSAYIIYI